MKRLILLITLLVLVLLSSSLAPAVSARGDDTRNNQQSNHREDAGQTGSSRSNSVSVWARTIGGSGSDSASSIIQTSDGGYVVAGTTNSFGLDGYRAWVFKLDSQGSILWQKAFDFAPVSPGIVHEDFATGVVQGPDTGIVVVGSWDVSDRFGCCYPWVAKLDNNNGTVLWARDLGFGIPSSIDTVKEGGYIVSGTTVEFQGAQPRGWLIRLNASGNMLWGDTYGTSSGATTTIFSVHETLDHGFVGTGSSESMSHVMLWVLKTDQNGSLSWQKTYNGPAWSTGASIAKTLDKTGGYVVLGVRGDVDQIGESAWILQLDSTGGIIWERSYGKQVGHTIIRDRSNGYVTALQDGSALKIDSHGNVVWHRKYADPTHGWLRTIIQTRDSGFLMAGITSVNEPKGDVWLIKTSSNGSCCKNITSNVSTNVTVTHSTTTTPLNTAEGFDYSTPNTWYVTTSTDATTHLQCTSTIRR